MMNIKYMYNIKYSKSKFKKSSVGERGSYLSYAQKFPGSTPGLNIFGVYFNNL